MCELFGFSGAEKTDIREYLKAFFSHGSKNPHGYGLMYDDDRKVIKEPVNAADSERLDKTVEELGKQETTLAHIRFATVGSVDENNCHPFTKSDSSGRIWTLIHNGTIYTWRETYNYFKVQKGDTDSERLFLAFIDRMNDKLKQGELSERERFEAVNEFITENSPRNKLNLILYDGELMYAHKNMKNTLGFSLVGGGVLISTTPLCEARWHDMPMAQVVAYRQGKEVYRGEKHEGEFIPNLEYITALDAMHI